MADDIIYDLLLTGNEGEKSFKDEPCRLLDDKITDSYFSFEFEKNIGGHDGLGHVKGKPGHVWNVAVRNINTLIDRESSRDLKGGKILYKRKEKA